MNIPIPRTSRQLQLTTIVALAYALFVIGAIGLVKIAFEVREAETLAIDRSILESIHHFATPFLDRVVPLATEIGGPLGTIIITLLIGGILVYRHHRRRAVLLIAAVAGATGVNMVLKSIFGRARPDLWERLVVEHSYSFPSGHATVSAALGAALVIVTWNTRWRWRGVVIGIIYPLFIGLTRLYLGVHYPTDVLAGWIVGGAWTAVSAALLYSKFSHKSVLTK